MSFVRGIGNIASGPISVALLMMARAVDRSDYAFGKVSACCLYAGVCMAFSALLGGVGFSAFTHEEKTQKQKMGRILVLLWTRTTHLQAPLRLMKS